jgi:hypothetical protein
MDNQANSPDYQQMDVSENCTTDTSSISPTNQTDSELNIVKSSENNVEKISSSFNSLNLNVVTMSKKQDDNENRNTLSLSSSSNDQQMKLTPVRHHPLEFFDDNDSEDSSSFSNSNNRNFPDVVLMTHNSNNQPSSLHLTTTQTKSTKTSSVSNDLVNSVNNNGERCQRIKYREPSPVSI